MNKLILVEQHPSALGSCKGCFYYINSALDCPPVKSNCLQNGKDHIWVKQVMNENQHVFNNPLFPLGTHVEKIKGSEWEGKVVGFYSTSLTPRGYAVESSVHAGSVQIYPESALRKKENG